MSRLCRVSLSLLTGLCVATSVASEARAAGGRSPEAPGTVDLQPRPSVRRFALVIGNNSTLDPAQAPLRFADDDAARIAELLVEVGVDVELLASFDRDSQALFSETMERAAVPSETVLRQRWTALNERMQAAKESGEQVDLLLFYSGHGDVGPDGQGFLTLQGGKLTRSDLFQKILAVSVADHNHLIVDACRSEQFVLTRGGKPWKPDRSPVDASRDVQTYLDTNHLGAFPQTGVILAHSADQQTHEWERYRGGVFSHEVISGLRGAADLNGDGEIEYSELGAFVAAANSSVQDPRARLEVVVRPPERNERRPLLVHDDVGHQRVVLFTGNDPHLYTLEDARGIRIADIRRAGNSPGYVRLPTGDVYVQRHAMTEGIRPDETKISAATGGLIPATALSFRPAERASRGALDQAFREGLFATPYGLGYYQGYVDQRGLLGVDDPTWRVEVWKVEDGAQEKVDEFVVEEYEDQASDSVEIVAEEPRNWWDTGSNWGGVFLGTVFTPFAPKSSIEHSRRITANQVQACLAPSLGRSDACSPIRGLDLRWQFFRVGAGKTYPSFMGYLRTGYGAGRTSFSPDADPAYVDGQGTDFIYRAVPIYLGGNLIAFDKFPVRPYLGAGFGFDVLTVRYRRFNRPELRDTSGRIGFELHAGVEARITNFVALTAEVMQQWSAKRKLTGVPDFANESLAFVTGIAVGIPLSRSKASPRRRTTVIRASRKPKAPNPLATPTPPDPPRAGQNPVVPEAPVMPETPEAARPPTPPAPATAPSAPQPPPSPN